MNDYQFNGKICPITTPALDDIRYFHDIFQKAGLVGRGAELKSAEALVTLLRAYITVKKSELNSGSMIDIIKLIRNNQQKENHGL
jgi:hypothetical protein